MGANALSVSLALDDVAAAACSLLDRPSRALANHDPAALFFAFSLSIFVAVYALVLAYVSPPRAPLLPLYRPLPPRSMDDQHGAAPVKTSDGPMDSGSVLPFPGGTLDM